MAKRKRVQAESVENSGSSPLPNGLLNENHVEVKSTASPSKRRKVKKVETEIVDLDDDVKAEKKVTKKKPISKTPGVESGRKAANGGDKNKKGREIVVEIDSESEGHGKAVKKVQRKRKTAEEKAAEAMPIAVRTKGHKLFIGAHVSAAGGVQNSVSNSVRIGANAFALFLKSQRKWANPPLAEDSRISFLDQCKSNAYKQHEHVVPHGSYLVNLAHTDKERTEQAYASFLDDLKRCEKLGIELYNFHPGSTVGEDRQKAIAHLASNINRAHKATSSVVTLLENMAAGGNVIGSTFEDLRDTIALVHNKQRVGVCLDTCHAFAGGYDLRTPSAFKATMDAFDEIVGFQYLRAVHMNDSKAPFASHRDLHANIGTGFLGLRAFHNLINDPRFEGLPLILETPLEAKDDDGVVIKDEKGKVKEDKEMWAREIKLLESLYGADPERDNFLALEKKLARKGEPERSKMSEQIEKKREKEAAKSERAAKKKSKKGKKGKGSEQSEDSALSEPEDEDDGDGMDDTQRLSD